MEECVCEELFLGDEVTSRWAEGYSVDETGEAFLMDEVLRGDGDAALRNDSREDDGDVLLLDEFISLDGEALLIDDELFRGEGEEVLLDTP